MKLLEVTDLKKNYGDLQAVKGVNFSVNKGEFVALLGPNGAGKSTTINILCTLLQQTAGTVSYGDNIIGKHDNQIRKNIGIVFQDNVLDKKLTVIENLITRGMLYYNNKDKVNQQVSYIIETLKMDDFKTQMYGTLSGGQRRRVDIARALLHSPEILYLDEPTTGLDPSTRKLVWDIMKTLRNNGLTIFLTTHYMEETMGCDKVMIMNDGNIICSDSPENLRVQYSNDTLKVMGDIEKIKTMISDYEYKELQDVLEIQVKNTVSSIDLLQKLKPYITAFEVLRGNMDDVFLNLTGTRLN